jgi:DNA replication protein DnaC
MHGYPENYLDVIYKCPDCHDTGYAKGTFCHCLLALAGKIAAKELNQTAQIQLCQFETFSLDYYRGQKTEKGSDCYQAMKKILHYCQHYAEHFNQNSPSILMFGKTGRGKTHLSLSIASVVIEHGYSVLYDSVINFLRRIEQEHFGKSDEDTNTMELLLTCDLLILDDLGTEFDSAFYQSTIYNLINTRMNRSLPTIISTNLDYNGISHRYEERITSRIFATYFNLCFVGSDVRILKAQEARKADLSN